MKKLIDAAKLAIAYCGDLKGVATRTVAVLRTEGLQGLWLRLRILLDQSSNSKGPVPRPVFARTRRIGYSSVPRTYTVDIIVCVHNALDDTLRCLESVADNSSPPYNMVIVDDGSADETALYIQRFAAEHGAQLIRNPTALGYTFAANMGLCASSADFVVLLNSDTIVSPSWLDRMIACALSDEAIGVVGPLSNTASWQSVPRVIGADGDWAGNPLPQSWTVARMAAAVGRVAPRMYPRVGFVNGFCFLIRRATLEAVGRFDEEGFGRGYGEENDFCLRAVDAGWQLAIAEDAYVFHAQSKSYSPERRHALSHLAGETLARKHGDLRVFERLRWTQNHPLLQYMRARCAAIAEESELFDNMQQRFAGKRMLFVLPVTTSGGGGNVVLCEVLALRRAGIDAEIANLEFNRRLFERHHPDLHIPARYFRSPAELSALASEFDAVVASYHSTVEWLKPLAEAGMPTTIAYYVQDFEPYFFASDSPEYRRAKDSYTDIAGMRLFTKTRWTRDTVGKQTGAYPELIGPSYDVENFYPGQYVRSPNTPLVIIAMVRPNSPRRSPELTMRILRRLKSRLGNSVVINIFGTRSDDTGYLAFNRDFEHTCLGELSSPEVADALRESDVFLDLSSFQAMGLTAMEAMSSGVAVIGPQNGGLAEIIDDRKSGLLVDTTDEDACFATACRLIADRQLREHLRDQAFSVTRWTPTRSASRILEIVFGDTGQATSCPTGEKTGSGVADEC
ncbi:MAG: glycosyltransferase [Candidatus Accumulibacter sp.]|uniref:Glycosyltransferase n=1 Tax=Candidatus Accumulibacter affinis TaxID=2954384 RepID=A0A935TBU0_9PROT|nr:glycosyltransferase [Candidatus Accumulibacter affinis]